MPLHLVKPTVLPATKPKLEYEVLQQDASPPLNVALSSLLNVVSPERSLEYSMLKEKSN
jgi:hypothetical protein